MRLRHNIDLIGYFYNLLMLCFIYLLVLYSIWNLKQPACILLYVCCIQGRIMTFLGPMG